MGGYQPNYRGIRLLRCDCGQALRVNHSGRKGISFTEKEYDEAVRLGVPVMALVLKDNAKWAGDREDKDNTKRERLTKFAAKVKTRMVEHWSDTGSLRAAFAESFMNLIAEEPREGWIRSSEAASPEIATEIARLSKESESLRAQLAAVHSDDHLKAKQDSVIQRLKNIRSESLGDKRSMWGFFGVVANTIFRSTTAKRLAEVVKCDEQKKVMDDIRALVAYDVLEPASFTLQRARQHDYQSTALCRELAKRISRERIESDPARQFSQPK